MSFGAMTSSDVGFVSFCRERSKISPYGLLPYVFTTFAGFHSSVAGAAADHDASVKITRSLPSASFSVSTARKPAALPLFVASARSSFLPLRSAFVTFACVGRCQSGFVKTGSPLRKTSAPLSQLTRSMASFTLVSPRSNSFFNLAALFASGESLQSHFHSDEALIGAAAVSAFELAFALPLPFDFASAFSTGFALAITFLSNAGTGASGSSLSITSLICTTIAGPR